VIIPMKSSVLSFHACNGRTDNTAPYKRRIEGRFSFSSFFCYTPRLH
jgi:hypothetical protein